MDNNLLMGLESPEPTPDAALEASEANFEPDIPEKPDFVKKIESFDMKNLTKENIDFMTSAIQNRFLENFPVEPELVAKIPDHILVVDAKGYKSYFDERDTAPNVNIDGYVGFYDKKLDKMIINSDAHETPGTLFATLFHEGLHFVSMRQGAGFGNNFTYPTEIDDDAELSDKIDTGVQALIEGTTQLITFSNVIYGMGFDKHESMFSYEPEWRVMEAFWAPFSKESRFNAYFKNSMEDIRIGMEKQFKSEGHEVDSEFSNGIFAECLARIGSATNRAKEALENWVKGGDPEEVKTVLDGVYEFADQLATHLGVKEEEEDA